jgi:hypothetical protein
MNTIDSTRHPANHASGVSILRGHRGHNWTTAITAFLCVVVYQEVDREDREQHYERQQC